MKNPDHPSMFLVPYLMELVETCKEAKLSFLILNESINKIHEPFPQISDDPDNWEREEEYWATYRRSWTMKRIALHSFILSAANISKIVWPYVDKRLEEPKRRRRLKRGQHL